MAQLPALLTMSQTVSSIADGFAAMHEPAQQMQQAVERLQEQHTQILAAIHSLAIEQALSTQWSEARIENSLAARTATTSLVPLQLRPSVSPAGLPGAAVTLLPAPPGFPTTLTALYSLTSLEVSDLLAAYGRQVPEDEGERFRAFKVFIGCRQDF